MVAVDRLTAGCRMKRLILLVASLVVWLCISGCSEEQAPRTEDNSQADSLTAQELSTPEFSSLLASEADTLLKKYPNTMIVDVRTAAEREQVRIAGSVPVSLADILSGQAALPRDKPLLLVCAVGGRSYAAGLYLAKEKYPRIYNLRGGISAWEKAGLPLEYGKK